MEKQNEPGKYEPTEPWSVMMAESVMVRQPLFPFRFGYDYGLILKGIEQVWLKTGDNKYFKYIKDDMDTQVTDEGNIRGYAVTEFNIDNINNGKLLFPLYRQTCEEKYKKAAFLLREQLRKHPRTRAGGFWHKGIYPHQMWLDGIFMASPFYAEFAKTFHEPEAFDDIVHQVVLMNRVAKDYTTGLLYHGYDESHGMKWADPVTGCSPHFWGRAMGWYAMAIVDILDYLPESHSKRSEIIGIFESLMAALVAVQDQASGVWYQIVDQGQREGNYLEASASCMYVYALAKAVKKGYINKDYLLATKKGYEGILKEFIAVDENGLVNLNKVCTVAGLGGNPYRDGSFEYYISEPVKPNDPKGLGSFILAAAEMENL